MARSRRRYELRSERLNEAIEALIGAAQDEYGAPDDKGELARQMAVTGLRLLRDDRSTGDLVLVNSAMKELRHAMRVFAPYEHVRKVAVFGSARTPRDHPDWIQAERFSESIARRGWMVITGAGPGIMEAAQGGAGREQSFGVNIRLPFEQGANEVIAGDAKCIQFRYFFTRKVTFVKELTRDRVVPRRLRDARRGFRSPHLDPDRQERDRAGRLRRRARWELLEGLGTPTCVHTSRLGA